MSFFRYVLPLALALLGAAPVASAQEMAKERVEQTVRKLLMREPELIYRALEELRRRQEQQMAEAQKAAIVDARERLVADARDPVLGDPEGDVTMVEFFDYRCGYCRSMIPTLEALREREPSVRYVMKEFPILGPESLLAAKAALAAGRQDAYKVFHDALMRAPRIDMGYIESLAEEQGLDVARLKADMESEAILRHIEDNLVLAQNLGIGGTPAFVIGYEMVPGAVPGSELAQMIEAERSRGDRSGG